MDVILLEKIDNLGTIGDQVKVRSGYGRNFLLPKGKATLATPENIAIFEQRRAELEAKHAGEVAAAQERAARIREIDLKILAKAGVEGKIFGSVGTIDIVDACEKAGVTIERSEVRLPDGPLRTLGEHEIEIALQTDVTVSLSITVVPDDDSVVVPELAGATPVGESIDPVETGDDESGG